MKISGVTGDRVRSEALGVTLAANQIGVFVFMARSPQNVKCNILSF